MSGFAYQEVPLEQVVLGSSVAELALLGDLLADNSEIDRVADQLDAADFSVALYGRIFAVIVREAALGRDVSPATLAAFFRDDQEFEEASGVNTLVKAQGQSIVAIKRTPHVPQILEFAARRRIVGGLSSIQSDARDLAIPVDELLATADTVLAGVADRAEGAVEVTGAEAVDEVIAEFGRPMIGVRCGNIGGIDDLAGPLRPGQMIILAGRPGMAKTATALSYGLGAAMNGHGVLFVSLEMSAKELGARMASDMCFDAVERTGVPFEVIRDRRPTTRQISKIQDARDLARKLPFRIVDRGGCKLATLESLIRRHKRRMAAAGSKLELVIVDYLQLLSPDHRMNSNYEAVSEISKRLKQAAKNQGVAIMALAQLSRAVEGRPDRRPQLSDLRDSGQIEQDADTIIFLYREAYYVKKEEPKRGTPEHYEWATKKYEPVEFGIDFICAKRRDGPEGYRVGLFYGEFQAVRGSDAGHLGEPL